MSGLTLLSLLALLPDVSSKTWHIACVGDSVTAGGHGGGDGWPERLAKEIDDSDLFAGDKLRGTQIFNGTLI